MRLHASTSGSASRWCWSFLGRTRGWIVTPNLDHLRRLRRRRIAARATVERIWPSPTACRSCGPAGSRTLPCPDASRDPDLIWSLSRGGGEGTLRVLPRRRSGNRGEAARGLRARFRTCRVAGSLVPRRASRTGRARSTSSPRISRNAPGRDLRRAGFTQTEVLIERLRPGLPSAWWMGVGISFSFVAGRINQAPVWLRKIGCGGSIAWRRSPAGSRAAICSTACPSGAALIARSAVRGLRSRRK